MRPARIRSSQEGFSLIELLVVIIILGVLAAIALPVLASQREKAQEKTIVSDIRNAVISAEDYRNDNDDSYAGLTVADLITSPDVVLTFVDLEDHSFVLSGSHPGIRSPKPGSSTDPVVYDTAQGGFQ